MRSKNGLSSPFTTIASVLSWAEAVPANSSSANAPSTPVIFMDVLLVRIGGSRRPPGATIRRFAAVRTIHFAQCLTIAQLTGAPPAVCVGRRAARQDGALRQGCGRLRRLTRPGGMRLMRACSAGQAATHLAPRLEGPPRAPTRARRYLKEFRCDPGPR